MDDVNEPSRALPPSYFIGRKSRHYKIARCRKRNRFVCRNYYTIRDENEKESVCVQTTTDKVMRARRYCQC